MSAFEDFVNLELPKRPVMLTLANTGYDNDPNGGGAPAVVQNSPQGTYFFRTTGSILYVKNTSAPGSWAVVGSGGGGSEQTAALAWNVTTTGNDSTGDGSIGAPFLTPAGALAKFKALYGPRVRFLVDILLGAGNFPGFNVQGWEMDPATNLTPVGFRFIGTWVNPTLAGGTTSGTWTSITPGNTTADVVYLRTGDSAQAWVAGALKGMFVRFLTGTSATTIVPIFGNTATELILPSVGTLGSIGGTYDIVVPGTIINTAVPIAPGLVAANAVNQSPTPLTNGIGVYNVEVAPSTTEIRFENIEVAPPTSTFGINIQGEACTFTRCRIRPGTGACVNVNGGIGTINVTSCLVNPANASFTGINASGTGIQNYTQNLITAGAPPFASGQGATGINVSGQSIINATTCLIEEMSFGIPVSGQVVLTLSGTTITGRNSGVSQLIRSRVIEGNSGSLFLFASSLALRDNPASTGLEIQGPAFASLTALFMSGSLYAIGLAQGGRVKVGPTSIVTSVGGLNDVILDDFAAPTTVANMRAQTPKVLSNSYGTAIWE